MSKNNNRRNPEIITNDTRINVRNLTVESVLEDSDKKIVQKKNLKISRNFQN